MTANLLTNHKSRITIVRKDTVNDREESLIGEYEQLRDKDRYFVTLGYEQPYQ